MSLGFTSFGEIFAYVIIFNPTIEKATFRLRGWLVFEPQAFYLQSLVWLCRILNLKSSTLESHTFLTKQLILSACYLYVRLHKLYLHNPADPIKRCVQKAA